MSLGPQKSLEDAKKAKQRSSSRKFRESQIEKDQLLMQQILELEKQKAEIEILKKNLQKENEKLITQRDLGREVLTKAFLNAFVPQEQNPPIAVEADPFDPYSYLSDESQGPLFKLDI